MFQGTSVTVREQILGLSFLLLLCGLQGLNSVCRAHWQVPLLAETSCLDLEVFRRTCLSFCYHSRFFVVVVKMQAHLKFWIQRQKRKSPLILPWKYKRWHFLCIGLYFIKHMWVDIVHTLRWSFFGLRLWIFSIIYVLFPRPFSFRFFFLLSHWSSRKPGPTCYPYF